MPTLVIYDPGDPEMANRIVAVISYPDGRPKPHNPGLQDKQVNDSYLGGVLVDCGRRYAINPIALMPAGQASISNELHYSDPVDEPGFWEAIHGPSLA